MSDFEKQVKDMIEKLSKMKQTTNTEIGKAVAKSCMQIQRYIIEDMTTTPSDESKSYYTHNKTIPHHPSFEGNAPAVDTGTLRRSITFEVEETENGASGKVGSILQNPAYGRELEYGTSKVKPRPWLRPALEANKENIKQNLVEAMRNL